MSQSEGSLLQGLSGMDSCACDAQAVSALSRPPLVPPRLNTPSTPPPACRRLFLGLAQDRHRPRIGLEPFPAPAPPPAPVTAERKKEILSGEGVLGALGGSRRSLLLSAWGALGPQASLRRCRPPSRLVAFPSSTCHAGRKQECASRCSLAGPADVRVLRSVAAGRGGRVRDEQESATAKSITVTSDGREQAAAAAAAAPAPAAPAEAPAAPAAEAPAPPAAEDPSPPAAEAPAAPAGTPANVEEARAWIAAWKAKQQGGSGSSDGETEPAEVPANVAEAREWIRRWRAQQLESKLPAGVASE